MEAAKPMVTNNSPSKDTVAAGRGPSKPGHTDDCARDIIDASDGSIDEPAEAIFESGITAAGDFATTENEEGLQEVLDVGDE